MSYPILYPKTEQVQYPAIAGVAIAGLSIAGDETDHPNAFTDQGLGTLTDAISCTVNEKRNAEYELTMQYPISGVHFSEIEQRCFIYAKPNYTDDPQAFRIYKITKPLNGVCTIYARHISYDLSGYIMPANLSASGLSGAIALLNGYSAPFLLKTTKSGSGQFKTETPASVRSWLGGKQGSLLDLYGGEWHWDMYEGTLSTSRGEDRGVTIRYGKNLTLLTQDELSDGLYTGVLPFYKTEDEYIEGNLVTTGITLDQVKILFLDCSAHFGTTVPTRTQLNNYATTYINNNNLTSPDVNITLDFVQLEGLAERVDLCDTVTVEYEALGISAKKKCIEVTWDVIKDRYVKAVFGNSKASVADTVVKISEVAEKAVTPSFLEQAVNKAASLITGNSGGYVILHDGDEDGYPDELLVMNTPDINTATHVWRWNQNGLGFSSTGYDGNFGLAMTADGEIVADFITTGILRSLAINNGDGNFTVNEDGEVVAKAIDIRGGKINIETTDDENDYIRLNNDNRSTAMTPYSFKVIYDGTTRAILGQMTANHHGGLWLYNANGNTSVGLVSDSNGGLIYIKDKDDNENIKLLNSATGGYIHIYNSDGTLRAALSDWIDVYDSGTRTIRLNGVNGNVSCVSLTQTSDRSQKTKIKALDVEKACEFIYALKPSEFEFKAVSGVHHGFIAQDIEEIADWEIVKDDEGTKGLAYYEIIADLVATVQKQNERIEALERKLNDTD